MTTRDPDGNLVGEFIRSILESLGYAKESNPKSLSNRRFRFSNDLSTGIMSVGVMVGNNIYLNILYWADGTIVIHVLKKYSGGWHSQVFKRVNVADPDTVDILTDLLKGLPNPDYCFE